MRVEIDDKSGFCFGVVRAITEAERALGEGGTVYSLGDIVHNRIEVQRLQQLGQPGRGARVCLLQQQLTQAQAVAQKAMIDSAATMTAVSLGIDAKTIPYVLKMADLSQVMGQDG